MSLSNLDTTQHPHPPTVFSGIARRAEPNGEVFLEPGLGWVGFNCR